MKIAVLPALALGFLASGCGSSVQAEAKETMIADCAEETGQSEAECTCATDEAFARLDGREREVIARSYMASRDPDSDMTPAKLAEEIDMDLDEIRDVAMSAATKMNEAVAEIDELCGDK